MQAGPRLCILAHPAQTKREQIIPVVHAHRPGDPTYHAIHIIANCDDKMEAVDLVAKFTPYELACRIIKMAELEHFA